MLPFQPKINDTDPSALLIQRFTDLVTELTEEDDSVVTARAASSTEATCIQEQPPKPPTASPTMAPTRSPTESASPQQFSSAWMILSMIGFVVAGMMV